MAGTAKGVGTIGCVARSVAPGNHVTEWVVNKGVVWAYTITGVCSYGVSGKHGTTQYVLEGVLFFVGSRKSYFGIIPYLGFTLIVI